MTRKSDLTINTGGQLMDFSTPRVMGILNVTPDSFYASSRKYDERSIEERTREIVSQGGDIIDIGAYSTRPGWIYHRQDDVSEEEEARRLRMALAIVRRVAPDVPVSIDTFRADIARMTVEEYGAAIINDVSGGDDEMYRTVAELGVPYILMHIGGTIDDMHSDSPLTSHSDASVPYMQSVMRFLAERIDRLRSFGARDIILDPGFGFGKSMEQNYHLLSHLDDFGIFSLPVLVGVSRKSMIWRLLGTDAAGALGGTTVCNTIGLLKGADILRVHDVAAAIEAVRITQKAAECY